MTPVFLDALLGAYRVPPGHFDEVTADGRLRPHWEDFLRHGGDLSAPRRVAAQARVARQIHENGITYNVYAAPEGTPRPWDLDVLPAVVPAAEWDALERGLHQRTRLLEAIAQDLYGQRHLFVDGLLPPALILGHRGYLRTCHGVRPPGGRFLHHIAFDLGRDASGEWIVVGTRTQAPSGAGYALENRTTLAPIYPDTLRRLRVRTLAPYFRAWQEGLLAAAPTDGESPHVVLLTPGPYNETYFEQAYLARELGFTLVEGGDLVARDDRVYLKTVSGLRRVHAILRRLDDDFCDPLELRADSALGVPGLVQAWRAGHVLVGNAFGAGVLESAALLAYLPAACERLLGERLLLRSVETTWCGEPGVLDRATPLTATTVIKPAFPQASFEPVFAAELDGRGRKAWLARLRANPAQYTLEEYVPLSHVPVCHADAVEARALMLRVFVAVDGAGECHVMPGGLSRIAGRDRPGIVSGQRGGGSKDTWVLSDGLAEPVASHQARLALHEAGPGERLVSSRSGENLFWLGRYAERSESSVRLLRSVLHRLPDAVSSGDAGLTTMLDVCERHRLLPPAESSAGGGTNSIEAELLGGLYDRERTFGLAFNIEQTVRVAGAVRDRLSSDNWRLLTQLARAFDGAEETRPALPDSLEGLDAALLSLVAVAGLEMAHMTRDDGWRFLSLGRHLERLLYVVTTVREVMAAPESAQGTLLEWLLDLSDSLITYRARYMRRPERRAVTELLVFDRTNPRSAGFQLAKLVKHVRVLPPPVPAAERTALELVCDAASPDGPIALGDDPQAVDALLAGIESATLQISTALSLRYFSHVYERPSPI